MVETATANEKTMSRLSESDEAALVSFKESVNSQNFHIKPEANPDPFDPNFMRFLDAYVFDKSLTSLQPLRDKYEALPDSVKNPINIQKTLFDAPTNSVTTEVQAQAVINLAQNYLNIEETSDGKINEASSRALRERLSELQSSNTDIDVEFTPDNNNQRSVDFLNAVIKKQTSGAGKGSDDINKTLIHLWSLEQSGIAAFDGGSTDNIGEIFSLRNLVELISSGSLPSGAKAPIPEVDAPWDKGWTNNQASDLFFSNQVYNSIASSHTVDSYVLFDESPSNPNSEMLKQFARNIGIDPDKSQTFSEADIGRIAAEMLAYQARELCIDESDINNAIHRGDFMPHTSDLWLVEKGFGFPDSMKDQVLAAGKGAEWQLHYGSDAVYEHQSAGFATRFGSMDDEFVQQKVGLYSNMEEPERSEFIRSVYESPASFFGVAMWSDHDSNKTPYELRREEHYLPKLARMMEEGEIGLCSTNTPEDDTCAIGAIDGDSDCSKGFAAQAPVDETISDAIETNIKDSTGNNPDDVCAIGISDLTPCTVNPSPKR